MECFSERITQHFSIFCPSFFQLHKHTYVFLENWDLDIVLYHAFQLNILFVTISTSHNI